MTSAELAAHLRRQGKTCFAFARKSNRACSRWPVIGLYCRQHARTRYR